MESDITVRIFGILKELRAHRKYFGNGHCLCDPNKMGRDGNYISDE